MKHVTWGTIVIAAFLIDRVLKFFVQHLPSGKVFEFFTGFNFGYYLNPALFFFPAWQWIPWVALIVLVGIVIWFLVSATGLVVSHGQKTTLTLDHKPNWRPRPAITHYLLPILLGGLSNVYDRFRYQGVIDYVHIMGLATINIADILILLGIVFLIQNFHNS